MKLLILFTVLSIINVSFSTVRSIATIKGGKGLASLLNAGYFSFYNVVLIYTVAQFPLWQKCIITFVCNLIGVYVVKLIEEKMRKDKLWEIRATIYNVGSTVAKLEKELNDNDLSYSVLPTVDDNYIVFNIYSKSQKESATIKPILDKYKAKYFVSESKIL